MGVDEDVPVSLHYVLSASRSGTTMARKLA